MANTTITPTVGTLRLTTNLVITPLVAALALAGTVPSFNQNVIPGVGAVGIVSSGSRLSLSMATSVGAAPLAGVAPVLSYGSGIAPSPGACGFASDPPSALVGSSSPGAGTLSWVGIPPVLAIPNQTLSPTTALDVLYHGYSPLVTSGLPPATATLTLAGIAPGLGLQVILGGAGTAPLSLTGISVSLALGITPDAGTLRVTTRNSPLIQPSAGPLSLSGNAPVLGGAVQLAPSSGALSFASDVPIQFLVVPAPPCAALVVGGLPPTLLATHIVLTSSGSLALSGNGAGVGQSQRVSPSGTSINIAGVFPTLAGNLLTPTAGLQLTGAVPSQSQATILAPLAGVTTLTGVSAVATPGGSMAPGTASLAVTGATPALAPGIVALPATLSVNADAPGIGLQITPAGATLTLASAVPTVNGLLVIAPPASALSLNTGRATLGTTLVPAVTSVTYAVSAPLLGLALSTSTASVGLDGGGALLSITGVPQTQTGTLALTGVAPTLGLAMVPSVATVALASVRPAVNSLTTLTPSTGAAGLSSDAPSLANTSVPVPLTGTVTFGSDPPVLIRTGFVAPQTGVVQMGGAVPLILETTNGFIVPGAATVTLSGQPAVVPLYAPDSYHTVQSPGPDRYTVHSPG